MPSANRNTRAEILGMPVDRCSPVEFRLFVDRALRSQRAHRIVTLNPEICVAARRFPRFATIVRSADLITVDGIGVAIACWLAGFGRRPRCTGIWMLDTLCAYAAETSTPIAFLLRSDGLTTPDALRTTLTARWPSIPLTIGTANPHAPLTESVASALRDQQPAILIMNIGGVAQEEWVAKNAGQFPSLRVIVGVGGAIDYATGATPSPSPIIRRLGLEWLWRFIRQPWRYQRMVDAVIVFPAMLIGDILRRIRVPVLRLRSLS